MNSPRKIVTLKRAYLILMGITLLMLFFVHNTNPVKDGDVYFHLKYGEYHLQHKTLIMDHSIFSWTPASQYAPYCTWAADVFLFLLYSVGGWPLLFALKYLFAALPILIVWRYSRQTGLGGYIFTPFVLIIVLLGTAIAVYIKPELFSLVFLSLLSYLYFHVKQQDAAHRNGRLFLFYPLLFLFWINCHGVAFLGLMLLAAIICGELISYCLKSRYAFDRNTMAVFIVSGVLSAAVTVVNPYGIDLHRSFFHLFSDGLSPEIKNVVIAYQPLVKNVNNIKIQYSLQYWGIMSSILAIVYLANLRKFRNWDPGILLPNLFLGALALQVSRTTYYWPVFWAMSLIYLSSRHNLNLPLLIDKTKPIAKYGLTGLLLTLSLFFPLRVIYADYYTPAPRSYLGVGFSYLDPVLESDFLKKHRIGTRLFNSYNTGNFLIFDLFPAYKVFLDTRYFPYKKGDTVTKFFDLTFGRLSLAQFESEFNFDVALVEHQYPILNSFITSDNWKPVYYGIAGVVFAKDHLDLPFDIRKPDPHRFDGLKNVQQAYLIARTAQNLNDLNTSAYLISSMEKNLSHMTGFSAYHRYLWIWQEGLEAYARGDYDKAMRVFWQSGFQGHNLRVTGLLRQLINKKADMHIKAGEYRQALGLLNHVYIHFQNDSDIIYDTAVVAYLFAKKDQSHHKDDKGKSWRQLMEQLLALAPEHAYAGIARQLLTNENMSENLPLILNAKIKNEKLRTYNHHE